MSEIPGTPEALIFTFISPTDRRSNSQRECPLYFLPLISLAFPRKRPCLILRQGSMRIPLRKGLCCRFMEMLSVSRQIRG